MKVVEETVGQRLRRLRMERGVSQRELAEPGVSHAYISRIEAGTRTASVKALRMLAGKLGVSAEYLETGEERTLTDERAEELLAETEDGLIRIYADRENGGVDLYWRTSDLEERQVHYAAGMTLSEALAEAITQARLHAQEQRETAEHPPEEPEGAQTAADAPVGAF